MSAAQDLQVEGFFDPTTATVSYIVMDSESRHCALIDSVLDFEANSGRTRTDSADALIASSQVVAINFQTVAQANNYWR